MRPIRFLLPLIGLGFVAGCGSSGGGGEGPPYLERRAAFQTKLLREGPVPERLWRRTDPPRGGEEVTYASGGLKLKAWLYRPPGWAGERRPALVYFQDEFALGEPGR